MKFGIVTFPGSNGDYDAFHAVTEHLGEEAVYLWHKERDLRGADVLILPGGFSYGDYLRAGAIARFSPIMTEVIAHANRGAPVLAICNGFQVACESGLLPGALVRNASLRFVARTVGVRVENAKTQFTSEYAERDILRLPVAHGEGRFVADARTIAELEENDQVVFRYSDASGDDDESVNGSINAIAGIINSAGNVLGLMPHPERAVDPVLGRADGAGLFDSILGSVAA